MMVTIQKSVSACCPLHKTATSHQNSTFLDEVYLLLHLMFKWSMVHQEQDLENSSVV